MCALLRVDVDRREERYICSNPHLLVRVSKEPLRENNLDSLSINRARFCGRKILLREKRAIAYVYKQSSNQ